MKGIRISRPSPAMVVALIALVAATAGVGYAASKINGSEIKSGTIKGKKLIAGTVKSKQIKDHGVKANDLATGVIPPITPQARTFHDSADVTLGANPPDIVTVGTLAGLAAGDYALSGKAEVEPDPLGGTDTAQVICGLFVNGTEVDRSRLQIGENAATTPVVLRGTIPVQAAVAVPEGGTVTLGCAKGGANISIDASQRALTAIAVDLP